MGNVVSDRWIEPGDIAEGGERRPMMPSDMRDGEGHLGMPRNSEKRHQRTSGDASTTTELTSSPGWELVLVPVSQPGLAFRD